MDKAAIPVIVDRGDGAGGKKQMGFEQFDLLSVSRITYERELQQVGTLPRGIVAAQADRVVQKDGPAGSFRAFFDNFTFHAFLHPGNERHSFPAPFAEKGEVEIAPTHSNNAVVLSGASLSPWAILISCSLPSVRWAEGQQVAVMIKQQMQGHRSLALTKRCPIEEARAQIKDRRVQTQKLVLKLEHLLRCNAPTLLYKIVKGSLIDLPRPRPVGMRQRRAFRSIVQSQMPQLTQAAG